MPILEAPTGINILGEYGSSIGIRFDEISRDYGGGYDETELVGPTTGLLFLRLKYGFLPTNTLLTVVDDENSNTVTPWAQYLWLKFKRRKADGQAFDVTFIDPATNANSTKKFKFADSQLDYETITFQLYGSGLLLRQYIPLA